MSFMNQIMNLIHDILLYIGLFLGIMINDYWTTYIADNILLMLCIHGNSGKQLLV